MKERIEKYKYKLLYVIICICTVVLIWNINYNTKIEIYYTGEYNTSYLGTLVQIHYDIGSGFDASCYEEQSIIKRHVEIKCPSDSVNGFLVRFYSPEEITVDKIVIRNGIFDIAIYSGRELLESSNVYYVSTCAYDEDRAVLTPENPEWYMDIEPSGILNQEMCYLVNNVEKTKKTVIILSVSLMCLFAAMLFGPYKCRIYNTYIDNKFYVVSTAFLIVVWGLIIVMAGFSGIYAHPDEDVSRMAIDYYLTNWSLPDFSSDYVKQTFSEYGSTRLKELTVYYFLAGKFAYVFKNVFHIIAYFRSFNVFLFGIMVAMYIRYGQKCPWMIVGIAPTPQLWYIFSYATSDAWDYFLGFVIIFMIVNKASKLNRVIHGEKSKAILVGCGILFGLLYLGKKNYLIVFLMAFLIFLWRLMQERKTNVLSTIANYFVILVSFIVTVKARQFADYIYYDGKKAEILRNLRFEKKTYNYVSYRDNGNSLLDLFTKSSFLKETFESFTGRYGWMNVYSDKTYHLLIALMYIIILYILFKNVKEKVNHQNGYIYGVFAIMMFGVLVFMSGFTSWKGDFQAQGRYIFPAIFSLMPLAREQLGGNKNIKLLTLGVIALSIYSFSYFGICNLV